MNPRWLVTGAMAAVAFVAAFSAVRSLRPEPATAGPTIAGESATVDGLEPPWHAPQWSAAAPALTPAHDPPMVQGKEAMAALERMGGDDPARGARTRMGLNRAVERMYLELLDVRAASASTCAADGFLDDTIVKVRYRVSSTDQELRLSHGRVIHDDLPAELRACLDDYLRHEVVVHADELGGALATVDLEVIDILPTVDIRPPPSSEE